MRNKTRAIMIVDDDADDIELFAEALQEVDDSIYCSQARNGLDALVMLSDPLIPRPELIFLDQNMPRFSGLQCLARLKNDPAFRDIPVIIYTTSKLDDDKDVMTSLGAHDFVTKPCRFNDLVAMLSDALSSIHVE